MDFVIKLKISRITFNSNLNLKLKYFYKLLNNVE